MFQSTRPRGARPRAGALAVATCNVSIHAPAGGATGEDNANANKCKWFQSTRPRGARPHTDSNDKIREVVSIHAPAGGATHAVGASVLRDSVSIHAPAGGAT